MPTGVYQLLADAGLGGTAVNNTVNPQRRMSCPPLDEGRRALLGPPGGEHQPVAGAGVGPPGQVISGSLAQTDQRRRIRSVTGSQTGQERIAFQVSSESVVSLTLPLEPNAAKGTGAGGCRGIRRRRWKRAATAWTTWAACSLMSRPEHERAKSGSRTWRRGQDCHVVTTPPLAAQTRSSRTTVLKIRAHDTGRRGHFRLSSSAATGRHGEEGVRPLFVSRVARADNRRILTLNDCSGAWRSFEGRRCRQRQPLKRRSSIPLPASAAPGCVTRITGGSGVFDSRTRMGCASSSWLAATGKASGCRF